MSDFDHPPLRDFSDRVPPHDREAEQCVLGAMLWDNAVIDAVAPIVRPEDFYADAHRKVFEVIAARHAGGGHPVDLLILREELLRRGWLADAGGSPYLAELWDSVVSTANVAHYARIVRDKALLRELVRAGSEILRDAYRQVAPAGEQVAAAESRIYALAERRSAPCTVTLAEAIQAQADEMDAIEARRAADPADIGAIPTGIGPLDALIGGLYPRDLIVVAARPSVGKSAVALIAAMHIARAGKAVFVASIEMARAALAVRVISSDTGIEGMRIRQALLNQREVEAVIDLRDEAAGLRFFIDDRPSQTVAAIAANCRRLRRAGHLDVVFVDYLQLVRSEARRGTPRHEQVAEVSNRLKELARELEIPVVALAQLNRESEGRGGAVPGKPKLSDLKDSGQIEQDCDVVVLLHRRPEAPDFLDMDVAKQRMGPTGEVTVPFDRKRMRFAMAERGEA